MLAQRSFSYEVRFAEIYKERAFRRDRWDHPGREDAATPPAPGQ